MEEIRYIRLDDSNDAEWKAVKELFAGMYARMGEMGLMVPLAPDGADKWLRMARNTAGKFGIVILANKGEKAIGFAHGMITFLPDYIGGFPVGTITHVFVEDEFSRSGIGKTMVNILESWFLAKKVHSIELEVISGNLAAKEFWKKIGYLEELLQYRKLLDR